MRSTRSLRLHTVESHFLRCFDRHNLNEIADRVLLAEYYGVLFEECGQHCHSSFRRRSCTAKPPRTLTTMTTSMMTCRRRRATAA